MEESPNSQPEASALMIARVMLVFCFADVSVPRSMRSLQVVPQTHIQGDRHAHHNQRTATQDQEPPDHPHSRLG